MVKLAPRDPAEWIWCHGHVCSNLWPPHRHKVGGQGKEWQFPSYDTVYVTITCPWCRDEGCCNEASPYDHPQTLVKISRDGPLPAEIRPVPLSAPCLMAAFNLLHSGTRGNMFFSFSSTSSSSCSSSSFSIFPFFLFFLFLFLSLSRSQIIVFQPTGGNRASVVSKTCYHALIYDHLESIRVCANKSLYQYTLLSINFVSLVLYQAF